MFHDENNGDGAFSFLSGWHPVRGKGVIVLPGSMMPVVFNSRFQVFPQPHVLDLKYGIYVFRRDFF